ncbi:MAG: RNA pyrophosphohydrolase [Cohaesibacteraceae bacterium]
MAKQAGPLMAEEKRALPYRPCVGSIVVNRDGLVWMGRRLPNEEYQGEARLWQFPQGGIDEGEDAEKASLRELYEETSIRSVTLITDVPGWLTYDLPDDLIGTALKGKYRGQKQRWFVYKLDGTDSEIDVVTPPDGHEPEFDRWDWVTIEEAPSRAVNFKVPLYETIIDHLRGHEAIKWSSEPSVGSAA